MESRFSAELQDLIARAREVAVDLRFTYISSFHFFMADCQLDQEDYCIRSFVFRDKTDFLRYYEAQKAIQAYSSPWYEDPGTIPLAKDAEQALQEACFEQEKYKHPLVLPAHFFLAAIRDTGADFNRIIKPKEELYERLMMYYISCGLIDPPSESPNEEQKKAGWFSRLKVLGRKEPEKPVVAPLKLQWLMNPGHMPVEYESWLPDEEKVEVFIESLAYSETQNQSYAIVLKEKNGNRFCPVITGAAEAQAIAAALEKLDTEKPQTHRLISSIIYGTGCQVKETIIYGRLSGVFAAKLFLVRNNGVIEFESRMSDALVLCTMSNAPVYFARKLFEGSCFEKQMDGSGPAEGE